jgi:germination protein M
LGTGIGPRNTKKGEAKMQKARTLLVFFLCIVTILFLVGCNILDSLVKEGGGTAPLSQFLKKSPVEDAQPVITQPEQGEQTVKLYFADSSGQELVEVERTIPKTLSLARETVNQWLMGPVGGTADAYTAVSPETKLLDINIKNGIATVDLSKEFLEPYSNVAAETALYGLVNTVAQFSTVEIVQIRVEGKDLVSYRGLDLKELRFRNDLIGYSSGLVYPEQVQESNASSVPPAELEDQKLPLDSPSSLNIFVN